MAFLKTKFVSVVKVTATLKSDSGTVESFYFSDRYFAPEELDSAITDPIYPLIAEDPLYEYGGVGSDQRFTATRYTIPIKLYSKNAHTQAGMDLECWFNKWAIHSASVELRAYQYQEGESVTYDAEINLRDTLEVIEADLDRQDGYLTLRCKQRWFNDLEIGKQFSESDFPQMDEKWYGEYAPIPFADSYDLLGSTGGTETVIIDAPQINVTRTGAGASGTRFLSEYFAGRGASTSLPVQGIYQIYAKNNNRVFNNKEWIQLAPPSASTSIFFNTGSSGWVSSASSVYSLSGGVQYGVVDQLSNHAAFSGLGAVITHVGVGVNFTGSYTSSGGQLTATIYAGEVAPDSLAFQPYGSILAKGTFDLASTDWGSGKRMLITPLDRPVVIDNNSPVFTVVQWDNERDSSNYPNLLADPESGYTHYKLDKPLNKTAFGQVSNIRLAVELFCLRDGTGATVETSPFNYTKYGVASINLYANSAPDKPVPIGFGESLELKLGVGGIWSPFGLGLVGNGGWAISSPWQVFKFLLTPSVFGGFFTDLALDGVPELESLTDVSNSLDASWNMSFIGGNESVEQLLLDICEQARIVILKTRDDKLKLHYPEWNSSYDYLFDETQLGSDLQIVEVTDNPFQQVVNAFSVEYNADSLNVVLSSETLKQRRRREKYLGKVVFSDTEDSAGLGAYQQEKASRSKTLYGQRVYDRPAPFYQSATKTARLVNYLLNRYSELQTRVTFSIPRTDENLGIQLFDYVRLYHSKLPNMNGTSEKVKVYEDMASAEVWSGNVRAYQRQLGALTGEVIKIEEQGSRLIITIETVSQF